MPVGVPVFGGQTHLALKKLFWSLSLATVTRPQTEHCSLSVFGTWTCSFYYVLSANYVTREKRTPRLDGLPNIILLELEPELWV